MSVFVLECSDFSVGQQNFKWTLRRGEGGGSDLTKGGGYLTKDFSSGTSTAFQLLERGFKDQYRPSKQERVSKA